MAEGRESYLGKSRIAFFNRLIKDPEAAEKEALANSRIAARPAITRHLARARMLEKQAAPQPAAIARAFLGYGLAESPRSQQPEYDSVSA